MPYHATAYRYRGGGRRNGSLAPPPDPPAHPHQKTFPQEQNEIYQRGPKLEVEFGYTNFFWPLTRPPGIGKIRH